MLRQASRLLRDPWFTWLLAVMGAVAGLLLWVLTVLVSHSRIAGNGWSLSGNGALIVPFGLGPAIVAAGWTAIILRMRGHPRWFALSVASGGVALVLLLCSLLSLILLGPGQRDAGATASIFFGFLLYGWLLATSIAAAMIPAPDPARTGPPWWSIAAILLMPVTLIAGCEAGAGVLPA